MRHSSGVWNGSGSMFGPSGSSTNASSAGSSGRSSSHSLRVGRRPASEAAAAAGAGPLGVELAAAADEAQDAARIAAAAHVDYPAEERAMLAQAAALASDQMDVTQAGPAFVQSGLSPFGALLAVWREPSVAAGAVGAGRVGVDVWAGVTAYGYIVLWSQGDGSNAAAAVPAPVAPTPSLGSALETRLVDFEKFLPDSYRCLTAATFTMPKLLPGAGGKRGTLTFFVLTEEGHGLTYSVDIGVLLTQTATAAAAAADEEEEEDKETGSATRDGKGSSVAATPAAAAAAAAATAIPSEGSRRVGIVGHRRLLLRKALYPRDLPAGSGVPSASQAPLHPAAPQRTLTYHALSNCIVLTLDTELYAYSDANLHTVWQASVGPVILGGGGGGGGGGASGAAAAQAHDSSGGGNRSEDKKAASVAAVAAATSSAQRMDAKQRRTHAITSIASPSVLHMDPPSLLVAMNALAGAAGAAPFTLPSSKSATFHGQAPPPPFLVVGTKSGYLLRIELRRRDLGGGSSAATAIAGVAGRVVPDVRVLARFQEHSVAQPGVSGEEEAHVTGEQRDELARKKEDERRKKAGGVAAAASAAAAAAAATVSSSAGSAATPIDESAASSPVASAPLSRLGENGSGGHNAAAVTFDPTAFPSSPVLIGSPWFDPGPPAAAASSAAAAVLPSPTVRASAYGTSLTCLALVFRRGEWLCVVGCADGFLHVVARDGSRVYSDANGASQRAGTRINYTSSSSSSPSSSPHPVAFDDSFPSALLYTLVDPCAHATSARVAPLVRVVATLDGGVLVALDAAGVLRRWDLNQRCLAGRTHTDGVVYSDALRGAPAPFPSSGGVAAPVAAVHMELIYPGAHSELAVLYGPGGPLAGLGGAASPLVRMHSRGTQGSGSHGSGGGGGGMNGSDKESMTPAALLAAGLLLPSHLLVVCHTSFSLWRLQRLPRVLKPAPFALSIDFPGGAAASVLSAAPSVLSELGGFIAAYQAEDRRVADSYGVTHGEKLRLERSQSKLARGGDTAQQRQQQRESALDSREEMLSPDPLTYTPSPNAPLSPNNATGGGGGVIGRGRGDSLLRASSTNVLLAGHHSIGATPSHPGLVEPTSPVMTRPESAASITTAAAAAQARLDDALGGAGVGGDTSGSSGAIGLYSSPAINSAIDFYEFAPPVAAVPATAAAPSVPVATGVPPPANGSGASDRAPEAFPSPDDDDGATFSAAGVVLVDSSLAEPRGPVATKLAQLSIFSPSPHASASPSASASASPFPDSGGSGGSAQTLDIDTPANLREASAQVLPAISVHVDVDPDDE